VKKNQETCEIWEITVYGSTLDYVHGCGSSILEGYLPKYDLCFNLAQGSLHVFKMGDGDMRHGKGSRLVSTKTIPSALAKKLRDHVATEDQLTEAIKTTKILEEPENADSVPL
jgi:hypothetical protein